MQKKNEKNNLPIQVKAGKPVALYIFLGMILLFAMFGFLFSKVSITKYADFDEDRESVHQQVYAEITELPQVYETERSKLYCMGRNESHEYVFLISQKQYDKMEAAHEKDGENFRYRIEGKTQRIYKHMQEASTKAHNHRAGATVITASNYGDHYGEVYIDGTEASAGEIISTLCYGMSAMWLVIAVFIGVLLLCDAAGMKKKLAEYDRNELERLLNAPEAALYSQAGVGLTEKYVISYAGGFNVLPYDEIFWVYVLKRKRNFIPMAKYVMAATKRNGLVQIAITDDEKMLREIMMGICEKNPSVLAGYSRENRKRYQEYLKNKGTADLDGNGKSADPAGNDLDSRWREAYRANPHSYTWNDSKIIVVLTLSENTDSLFPLVPEKQWAIDGKTIDLWVISMVSITKDSVLGNIEYHKAMQRLQPYVLAQKDGWGLIRGLTLAEMEALFEGLPRDILNAR